MKMVKDFRLLTLIAITLVSLLVIISPFIFKKGGVGVTEVDANAKCSNLVVGGIISQASGGDVKTPEVFDRLIKYSSVGSYVSMVVDNNPGGCNVLSDSSVGLKVDSVKPVFIKISPDLQGSIKYFFKANDASDKDFNNIANVIQSRIESLNLQYVKATKEDNYVAVNAGLNDNVDNLIVPCKIVCKIVTVLNLQDGAGNLKIGNNTYYTQFVKDVIRLNGSEFKMNENFIFGGISLEFTNVTNSSVTQNVYFLNSDDVMSVVSTGGINYDSPSREYFFSAQFVPSPRSINIFKDVTKHMNTILSGSQVVLNGRIEYYLDGVLLSSLPIPSTVVTQPLQSLSIVGLSTNQNYLNELSKKTLMCLNSESLNFNLEKASSGFVKPLYKNLIYYLLLASVIIPASISAVLFFLKRKAREILLLLVILTQIPVTLGILSLTQKAFSAGWVLDLYTLLGILTYTSFSFLHVRFESKLNGKKLLKYLDLVIFAIAFVLLFTSFKGFGMSFIVGLLLKVVFYKYIFKTLSLGSL